MFLAHNGVNQPEMWEAWRRPERQRVHFIVHANPETDEKDPFAKKYGIFPIEKRIVPTKWSDPSVVFATQVLIREALARFPEANMFYLVSGADIPIRPIEFLLNLQPISRFQKLQGPGEPILQELSRAQQDFIRPYPKWRMTDFFAHIQWCALNKLAAQIIAEFDFSVFDRADQVVIYPPDEYYIGSALKYILRMENVPWDKVATDDSLLVLALRHDPDDPSPFTWHSLDQKEQTYIVENKITLAEAIQIGLTSEDEPNTVFLRKVAPAATLNLRGLFDWYPESKVSDLEQLFVKYNTDKQYEHHDYSSVYDPLFGPKREHVKKLLEVGIGTVNPEMESNMSYLGDDYKPGASLRAWRDFFPHAEIVGLDIDPNVMITDEPRITTYLANSTNSESITALKFPMNSFDVIIDDGVHDYVSQQRTLLNLWPYLKSGGTYIIEDVYIEPGQTNPIVDGHGAINPTVQALLASPNSKVVKTGDLDHSVLKIMIKP